MCILAARHGEVAYLFQVRLCYPLLKFVFMGPLNFSVMSGLTAANSALSNLTDNSESSRMTKNRRYV